MNKILKSLEFSIIHIDLAPNLKFVASNIHPKEQLYSLVFVSQIVSANFQITIS